MPYDGTAFQTEPKIEPTLKYGLEGLAQIESLLRHPAAWPRWKWDFTEITNNDFELQCGTAGCAIGLMFAVWGENIRTPFDDRRGFGLEHGEDTELFACGSYDVPDEQVTPTMVADRIAALLKEKGYRPAEQLQAAE